MCSAQTLSGNQPGQRWRRGAHLKSALSAVCTVPVQGFSGREELYSTAPVQYETIFVLLYRYLTAATGVQQLLHLRATARWALVRLCDSIIGRRKAGAGKRGREQQERNKDARPPRSGDAGDSWESGTSHADATHSQPDQQREPTARRPRPSVDLPVLEGQGQRDAAAAVWLRRTGDVARHHARPLR